MPKRIAFHSMANYYGDLYVIGGMDYEGTWQTAIHKLNCSYRKYQWTTIKQTLKLPRAGFPSIPVADSFCKPNYSGRFQANFFNIIILFGFISLQKLSI